MKNDKRGELERACEYCESSSEVCDENGVLCSRRGIVGRDFCCRHFSYDPLKRRPSVFKMPAMPDASELIL